MDFLERLRQKPPHVKTQYAFLAAFLATSLVGLIWVTTLPARFATIGSALESVEAPKEAHIGNSVDSLITDLRNTIAPKETPREDQEGVDFSFMDDSASGTTATTTGTPDSKLMQLKTGSGTSSEGEHTPKSNATSTGQNGTSARTILISTTTTKIQ